MSSKVEATQPEASKASDAEPQNALTNAFTDAEWTALKEFRKELPEIFNKAYDSKTDARTEPITLWGVAIDPTAPGTDARVSVILMKFLRARNLHVRVAKEMLIATLRWREEFGVEAACKEHFPEDVFGNLGHVFGKDKEGRPIIFNVYGGNTNQAAVFSDVARFIRWRIALMEKCITHLDFETVDQTLQVHDYEGVSLRSHDANSKNAATEVSTIFQAHYPELLYRKFFVNIPFLLTWVFKLFKPLIAAKTLAKMSVVGSGSYAIRQALLPHVDEAQLPEKYGGTAHGFGA